MQRRRERGPVKGNESEKGKKHNKHTTLLFRVISLSLCVSMRRVFCSVGRLLSSQLPISGPFPRSLITFSCLHGIPSSPSSPGLIRVSPTASQGRGMKGDCETAKGKKRLFSSILFSREKAIDERGWTDVERRKEISLPLNVIIVLRPRCPGLPSPQGPFSPPLPTLLCMTLFFF